VSLQRTIRQEDSMSQTASIRQYAIYDHPKDYPIGYVVREWLISGHGPKPGEAWTASTLDEARTLIPEGCVRLPDSPGDEETIAEVWMR
jgi:hypothetical protein